MGRLKNFYNSIKGLFSESNLTSFLVIGPMDFYELHPAMVNQPLIYHPTRTFARVEGNMKTILEQYFNTILSGWSIVNGYGIFIPEKGIWVYGLTESKARIMYQEVLSGKVIMIHREYQQDVK